MAAKYPKTIQQLFNQFKVDEDCFRYLAEVRWGGVFRCPSCSHTSAWYMQRGRFRCAACHADTSVTQGTVFAHSHMPIKLWFLALWHVVAQKHGINALGLSRTLGMMRQKTGWQLLQKIRRGMIRPHRDRLSGLVEVDEVLLGGKRHKFEGRSPQGKTLVFVAVEDKGKQGIGRIRMQIIPDATAGSLHTAVGAMVELGSTVRTDGWTSYQLVRWGYRHHRVTRQTVDPENDTTPLVHLVSSLLKRWLLGTHQGGVQTTHLQEYLDEFVFRFNRRTSRSRGKLFYRLVQNLLHVSD